MDLARSREKVGVLVGVSTCDDLPGRAVNGDDEIHVEHEPPRALRRSSNRSRLKTTCMLKYVGTLRRRLCGMVSLFELCSNRCAPPDELILL